MIKKYLIRTTLFVTIIIWCIIFLNFVFFSYLKYYKNYFHAKEKLNTYIKNFSKTQNITDRIEDVISNYLIEYTLWNKINLKNLFKKNFWTPYLIINSNNQETLQNFDENQCNKKFLCHKLNKNWYTIIIWSPIWYPKYVLYNDILKFLIFSFIFSLLISFPIFLGIKKIFSPVEENIKFMKNFVNIAWHELKTPLTNINLSAQLLEKEYNKEYIKDIILETNKMNMLIDWLLKLALIWKENAKEQKINICNTIHNIIKELQITNIKIHWKCFDIITKENHIYILLKNLLENAAKYRQKNSEIYIYLSNKKICIKNFWSPIKNPSKIFDLFFKEKNTNNWFWIWLALVKKICDVNKRKIETIIGKNYNMFCIYF